ncbi:MAG: hypothetical protein Q4C82_06070 [Eubacteriales bacterium]|nr:hypothetical protein [Eubacteriales bacterium]
MIRFKIAFVLRLVDDFSGACIRSSRFRFSVGERIVHPVEKAEGLYVFLEPQQEETRVYIEGSGYHSCSILVKKSLLDPEEPVADVRMYAQAGGGLPGCEYLCGTLAPPGGGLPAQVYARRTRPTGLTFREYRPDGESCILYFQGFTKENLLNRPYELGEGDDRTILVLTEKRGIGEYRAELEGKPPDGVRAGEPLVRIYRSVTDRFGAYAIPVECGEERLIREVMRLPHRESAERGGGMCR